MRDEEKQQSSKQSDEVKKFNVQRFLRKKWMLPAVYLGAAAIVLSAFFLMQNQDNTALEDPSGVSQPMEDGIEVIEGEAVPVTSANEVIKMPVANESEVDIVGYFYDFNSSAEEQEAALVYYNNMYYQNRGIDIAKEDGESFEVTAALSGTVVKAEKDPLLGHVVEINHEDGVITHYHSLEGLEVEEGTSVKQGDIIGRAGRNLYNADANVHVHFEIRHNGNAVNPLDYFNQNLETLVDESHRMDEDIASAEEDTADEEDVKDDEEKNEDEDKAVDEDKNKQE
ncbi:MAG: M23 family metallopeptidase [Bacillaceae bacterium]|uniref:M23 family metallopeptidase n=1 Tax=Alkalihalobacterium chitinilyticum TaxID=2980103 RepID=A0ABT5VHG7_9BACI|nr:M23 family metallopeptidase [Alkalihalobacterium chitinilyticum]MDE5414720.1 M23 family metallopeptidase [Alkalihalobacterium chitinilyticum]MEB1807490.1 M23 family metallopeptidase [Bacillaceae bacterium]